MKLADAFQSAHEGNFVTHPAFSNDQSMHAYNDKLYYEDGANLTDSNFVSILAHYDWARHGWYIKYPKEKVDREKLKEMHEKSKGYMLESNMTYESCIIQTK